MMCCMVDYSAKMEKLRKELHALLQPTGSQSEPASTSTPAPGPSLVPISTLSHGFVTPPTSQRDPLLQEAIPEINKEDIASLATWAEGGPENLTTPTTGTGTNIPGNLSTPGTVSQEAQQRTEERTKSKAEECISKSGSSEEEEEEDPISLSSNDKEYQESETSSQSDPVDKPETPPFKRNQSLPKKPTTRPKCKATRKQSTGTGSKARKRRRD